MHYAYSQFQLIVVIGTFKLRCSSSLVEPEKHHVFLYVVLYTLYYYPVRTG